MSILYQHIRLDTGEIFYVGIGRTEKRAYSHYSRNKHWESITRKASYRVEILKKGLTWQEACKEEILLIAKIGRKDLSLGTLVNMTEGGEGGSYWKNKKQLKEHVAKRSLKNKGQKRTATAIENLKQSHTGLFLSEETKDKIRKSHTGQKHLEETKEKIKKSMPNKVPVFCLQDNKVYQSIRDASRAYNLDAASLTNHLKGRQKSVKKLHFQLVDSE
jgi:hypothetical protein